MVNVAVAGANGGVGKTILEVLREDAHHKTFALSRKGSASSLNADALHVDYADVDEIVSALEVNSIHTVICAFGISGDSLSTSQLNLIKAADRSSTTKRFIPSSYAVPYPRSAASYMPPLQPHFDCMDVLEASSLEYTLIHNGVFLDYFAMPHIKTNLAPETLVIDVSNGIAAIPGSGDVPVTFTYSYDLAKFLVASLSLSKWSKDTYVVGETITLNDFVELAEEITGRKSTISYDSIEKLKRYEVTELPGHKALYEKFPKEQLQWFLSIFESWMADGTCNFDGKATLNDAFPDIKPLIVKNLLTEYWAPGNA